MKYIFCIAFITLFIAIAIDMFTPVKVTKIDLALIMGWLSLAAWTILDKLDENQDK
jgi:hypothetical protein